MKIKTRDNKIINIDTINISPKNDYVMTINYSPI